MAKIISVEEAVNLVQDNQNLVVEGFLVSTCPEQLMVALEKRFLETGSPRNITLAYCGAIGNAKGAGIDHLAHEGLIKRVIGGHWNLAPKLGKMAIEGKFEAYNLPQGVIAHQYRDFAAGKLGTITHVGLKTFIDPRLEGGKINSRTTEDLVELITLDGQEQLFYKRYPLDMCMIRATYADEYGNISMEKEPVTIEATAVAQAVHNSGGTVIVQVGQIVKGGTLDPKLVKIPGFCVDYIVVVPPEENMWETPLNMVNVRCGDTRIPMNSAASPPLDERKIIARRAAMELFKGAAVNLGIGVPEGIAAIAPEEGISDYMTLTVESGPVGGIPEPVPFFGTAANPMCILTQPEQFDFYDGGGLDLTFLGLAECGKTGDINVSRMGNKLPGCGGFINITQNSKKVIFCGSFTAKGLKVAIRDGKLIIEQEGSVKKFLDKVQQVTFNGEYAASKDQPVLYVTERAVFALKKDGLHLIEIAPGIDIERDILPNMDFKPIIEGTPKTMDPRIFREEPMGLGNGK